MKNRKRVWVPLLVLLLVAAIWYSRPVTLPDLMTGQELQEINVLIRSLGDWAQEPETATVSVPLTSPEGAALLEQLQDLSFCRSLTDPLIKPLAQAVNASHGSVFYEAGDWMFSLLPSGSGPMLLRDRRTSTAAPSRTERPLAGALGNSSGLWQRNMISIRNIFYINFYL